MLSRKGIMTVRDVGGPSGSKEAAKRCTVLNRRGGPTLKQALASMLCAAALFVHPVLAAEVPKLYQESTDALYNLDFNIAQRGFEELTRQSPDNPDYWNALASTIWLK